MLFDRDRYLDLKRRIDALPRTRLATLPTPLEEAPHLSARLRGPRILIKRDDLTGLALGGNKARMLEFRLAPELLQGADVIVAGYGIQSNHARQIAAACGHLGLDCYLVLQAETSGREGGPAGPQGNLLLSEVLGARIVTTAGSAEEQIAEMYGLADRLRAAGRRPHVTGVDDYDLSTLANADCMLELCAQCEAQGIEPNHIVVCSDGPTQAGLLVAGKYLRVRSRIVGIAPMHRVDRPGRDPDVGRDIVRLTRLATRRIGVDIGIGPADVVNLSKYVGPGYGRIDRKTVEAVRTVGATEGILLDPVYTGKAMAGLMDLIRQGEIGGGSTVVFLHTGGSPLLFLYAEELVRPDSPPAERSRS